MWRLAPLSPMEIGFVTFSETEMVSFFMLTRYPHIRAELVKEIEKEFSDTSEDSYSETMLLRDFLPTQSFGYLIQKSVAKVGRDGLAAQQISKARPKAAVDAELSLDDIVAATAKNLCTEMF
ncbi:hypothetical protein BGW38_001466 [Lunasporangiospora selenospora]|uniref:Uncharacterized protein n=1 Tax=Lunasporangiospora selenospora TaxID=979761 RepID=A0A9P6FTC7_9FUNG|nr:hypothetical protein BGW38_001466 [Lunasporangiospora selenospora]